MSLCFQGILPLCLCADCNVCLTFPLLDGCPLTRIQSFDIVRGTIHLIGHRLDEFVGEMVEVSKERDRIPEGWADQDNRVNWGDGERVLHIKNSLEGRIISA